MNQSFQETIQSFQPDIIFSMNISDDFDKKILKNIRENPNIQSFCWMSDDQWRFKDL
jgi:hypothetical protein